MSDSSTSAAKTHMEFNVAERKMFPFEDIQVHKELTLISEQKTWVP